jgi:hypothetical protein
MVMTPKLTTMLAAAGLVAALVLALPADTYAREAWGLARIVMQGDSFWSYDFQTPYSLAPTNADWPVTLIYTKNANVNKIHSSFCCEAGALEAKEQYSTVKDDPGSWTIDSDRGNKNPNGGPCSSDMFTHMRVYAPDGRFVNIAWGQYVIATTHYDFHECSRNPLFGYSEMAEVVWAKRASALGWQVTRDQYHLGNWEAGRPWGGVPRIEKEQVELGRHATFLWLSSGGATGVKVPVTP